MSEASGTRTYLICNEEKFELLLEANQTAKALKERFPLSLDMADLHRNEKYNYLAEELPTNSTPINRIEKGDVMLFGSDCLVIFYKSFETSYSYTRIGKIKNPEELSFLENEKTVRISIEEQKE
ncbi:hypothetical protein BAU15_10705 [Enterococcus sp. JM4C]|nr:hypothetical protein BAU15_10705 [Enterococcus sp. JM4C]